MNDIRQTSKQIVTVDVLAMKYWVLAPLSFTASKPVGFTFSTGPYSRLALHVGGKMPDQPYDFAHYVTQESGND